MRIPSRLMPPPRGVPLLQRALGLLLLAILLFVIPWMLGAPWWPVPAFFLALGVTFSILGARRSQRIAAERAGESICHFARAFERRSVDPWILRATYEHLATSQGFPIRADDRLGEDLGIDADDLGFEVVEIAARCGRDPEGAEANPWYDKLVRVCDLVLFLEHQPRVACAPT